MGSHRYRKRLGSMGSDPAARRRWPDSAVARRARQRRLPVSAPRPHLLIFPMCPLHLVFRRSPAIPHAAQRPPQPGQGLSEAWQHYLTEFGDDDDIVCVARGHDRQRMQAALEAVAENVSGQPQLFDRLFYKADSVIFAIAALLLLPEKEIEAIRRHVASVDVTRLFNLGTRLEESWARGSAHRRSGSACPAEGRRTAHRGR